MQDGSDLIAILNEEGNYSYVAPTTESILGINADEFIGKNPLDYIHEDDQKRIGAVLSSISEEKRIEVDPFRFQDDNGNWRWIETVITNMMNNPAVEGLVANSRDVTEQIERENKLRKSLQEKETLLMEIHHRVKNNLAVMSGLMHLQAFNEEDDKLKQKLFNGVTRIQAMGTIHELLYQSKSFTELDFNETIQKLISMVVNTFEFETDLDIDFNLDQVHLNVNQALPIS